MPCTFLRQVYRRGRINEYPGPGIFRGGRKEGVAIEEKDLGNAQRDRCNNLPLRLVPFDSLFLLWPKVPLPKDVGHRIVGDFAAVDGAKIELLSVTA